MARNWLIHSVMNQSTKLWINQPTDRKFTVASHLWDLQRLFPPKNSRLLWKWVGGSRSHSEFVFEKSSQNSPKPVLAVLIFWSSRAYTMCILSVCLHSLLKVVGYYDLSVLSMLVMGFQKSLDGGGRVGWALSEFLGGFFEFFKLCKAS